MALLLNEGDNVAIVLSPVAAGEEITLIHQKTVCGSVRALSGIERYHKIAIRPIEQGMFVYKYGEVIGVATETIRTGDHVHVHNIRSVRVGTHEN